MMSNPAGYEGIDICYSLPQSVNSSSAALKLKLVHAMAMVSCAITNSTEDAYFISKIAIFNDGVVGVTIDISTGVINLQKTTNGSSIKSANDTEIAAGAAGSVPVLVAPQTVNATKDPTVTIYYKKGSKTTAVQSQTVTIPRDYSPSTPTAPRASLKPEKSTP
ncbi:MAG: fimbrillin family protein [Bacteroides sp.]|nr:fimbrillin family protein [Bacteroides sp.]